MPVDEGRVGGGGEGGKEGDGGCLGFVLGFGGVHVHMFF